MTPTKKIQRRRSSSKTAEPDPAPTKRRLSQVETSDEAVPPPPPDMDFDELDLDGELGDLAEPVVDDGAAPMETLETAVAEPPLKKARRSSSTAGKNKTKSKTVVVQYSRARLEKLASKAREEVRKEFNAERDRVLHQVPAAMKDMFGQIGFGKFGKKDWYPVVIISPFDTGSPKAYSDWDNMYQRVLSGKLAKWAHLVYWISDNQYGVLAAVNFCPFEKASDKIQKRSWLKAQAKLESGTLKDEYARRYIPETLELLELSPEERRLRSPDPQQNWESFSAEDVLTDLKDGKRIEEFEAEYSDLEMMDDDDNADDFMTGELGEPKTAAAEDDDEKKTAAQEEPKKKQRGRPPKKKVNEDDNASTVVGTKVVKPEPPLKSKVQKLEAAVDEVEEDMEEDPPSEEDKDDFEFEVDSEPDSVFEEEDDLVATTKSAKGSKPVKKAPGKAKKANTPANQGTKSKTDDGAKKETAVGLKKKSAGKRGKPAEELSDKQKRKRASRTYKKNEEEILPTLERLRRACDASRMKTILETLTTLEKQVDTMYWLFIEHYKVPHVIKQVKNVFKAKKEDLTRLNELREHMRLRYEENKKVLPITKVKPRDSSMPAGSGLPKRDSMGSLSERSTKKRESVGPVNPITKSEPSVQRDSIGSLSKSDGKKANSDAKTDRRESSVQQYGKEGDDRQAPSTPSTKESSDKLADQEPGNIPKKLGKKTTHAEVKLAKDKSPIKPKAKKFSLTSLMRTGSQEKLPAEAQPTGFRRDTAKVKKQLPAWMRLESEHPLPATRNRLFGLEFYKEMARQFPADSVNHDFIAITLEAETYVWALSKAKKDAANLLHEGGLEAREESRVQQLYWGKLHAIVAVVSGRRTPGALLHSLTAGDFHRAKDLIELSDGTLATYFADDSAY